MEFHKLFSPDWPGTAVLPISGSYVAWGDGHMPLCLVIGGYGILQTSLQPLQKARIVSVRHRFLALKDFLPSFLLPGILFIFHSFLMGLGFELRASYSQSRCFTT
jgi:hypothetical protein